MNNVPLIDKLKCIICNKTFSNSSIRNKHLKEIHNLTYEQYILRYYFNDVYPTCNCGCGTIMKFISTPFGKWFNDYTSNHFPRKKHTIETKNKIKENTKKSLLIKYGVDNIYNDVDLKNKTVNKIRQTKKERYNNENYNNVEKSRNTKNNRYDNENYNNIDKINNTCHLKYDNKTFLGSDIAKEKIKNIMLDKYNQINPMFINDFKLKLFNTKKEKYGYEYEFINPKFRLLYNNNHSKIENIIREKINGNIFIYNNKEYDIIVDNDIFEIDGDFYHPSSINNLTIIQLNSILNDYIKTENIKNTNYNLYRIHTSNIDIHDNITIDYLKSKSYIPNYNIDYNTIIISKEYFKKYIDKNKLDKYIKLFIKFIRLFIIPLNYNEKLFNLFLNDEVLNSAFKYIIGINENNELFDFSINQIFEIINNYI